MKMKRVGSIRYACLIALAFPLWAGGQTGDANARRILDQMLSRYQEGIAGINDYTIETDQYRAYHQKTETEGWPSFTMRAEPLGTAPTGMNQAIAATAPSLFDRALFEKLREQAVYAGRQQVGGRTMHGIRADRIEGLFPENGPTALEQVLLVVDAETLDLDRMRAVTQVPGPDGRLQTVTAMIRLEEYRDHQGLRIPYKTTMTLTGLGEHISESEREQARQILRQLEQVPAEQRAMIERMMPPGQLEQARQALAGEPITFETRVREVRINTGTPAD